MQSLIKSGGGNRPCETQQPDADFSAVKGATSYRLSIDLEDKMRTGSYIRPLLRKRVFNTNKTNQIRRDYL